MTIPTSSAEHVTFAQPRDSSFPLRAAIGEILKVGVPETEDVDERLAASLAWLGRAQDVGASGALSGGLTLLRGWRTADAHATSAAVDAFLEIASALGEPLARSRACRAARALTLLPAGSSPPRLVAVALRGLSSWAAAAPDAERRAALSRTRALADRLERSLDAGRAGSAGAMPWTERASAAAALCAAADAAGDWRLAERGESLLDGAARGTALRDAASALARQPAGRWPHPRGVAALPGLLRDVRDAALCLGRRDILAAVEAEGETLLRRFELRRHIALGVPRSAARRAPGRFSPLAWASTALLWIEESERTTDPRPLNAALFALDALFAVQRRRPGVDDVDGAVTATIRTWRDRRVPSYDALTAVMLTRAMIAAQRLLPRFGALRRSPRWRGAPDVPRSVVVSGNEVGDERAVPRVVLYAAPDLHRAPRLLERWREWGFVPAAVVMERRPRPRLARWIWRRIAEDGWRVALDRVARRVRPRETAPADESTVDYCARRGIRLMEVGALDAPETVETIRELAPDLAVHVGSGILRAPLLGVPRLGTLNIHNGILPRFRGVNVAEWSALLGEPAGCTVHLVDPGVDTGDILLVREVEVRGARSIEALRGRVDRAQGAILGDVLRAIVTTGELPPRRKQRADEGRQFFRMHPLLRERLEARLAHSR